MGALKLLIVESNPALANVLKQIFLATRDLELVGAVTSATRALQVLAETRADVVVMDALLPDMGILEAISLALEKSPYAKIILLTDGAESRYQIAAMRYGASACIRKDRIATDLIQVVLAALAPSLKTIELDHPIKEQKNQI
ncbi:MAG: response regulator transcription factor [Chloroflexi bacterium]|nr:response regulator transcription factor [Chloroflexota bacterium]